MAKPGNPLPNDEHEPEPEDIPDDHTVVLSVHPPGTKLRKGDTMRRGLVTPTLQAIQQVVAVFLGVLPGNSLVL